MNDHTASDAIVLEDHPRLCPSHIMPNSRWPEDPDYEWTDDQIEDIVVLARIMTKGDGLPLAAIVNACRRARARR
jgi:hypothetical protein